MHAVSRLALTGLVALSLTFTAVPAQATDWTVSITDVMNLVYCLVGMGECAGLEPGADAVDITSDNAAVCEDGGGVWSHGTASCAPALDCFRMGYCGVDGGAGFGWPVASQWQGLSCEDAVDVSESCVAQCESGVWGAFMYSEVFDPNTCL
jgi:hypothetical protein